MDLHMSTTFGRTSGPPNNDADAENRDTVESEIRPIPRNRSQFNLAKLAQFSKSFDEFAATAIDNGNNGAKSNAADHGAPSSLRSLEQITNDPSHLRMVVIRYFLDRPGASIHNSSARLWFDPPSNCSALDIRTFLEIQKIALKGLLIEIYIDKFRSFMMLDAAEDGGIEWDFSDTTPANPAVLDVRITDLEHVHAEDTKPGTAPAKEPAAPAPAAFPTLANTVPIGLFSFSVMVGLETADLTSRLIPGSISSSFILNWGPYMYFVGGMMQYMVGISQIFRNNLYGTVAFIVFGSFWSANGVVAILKANFSADGTLASEVSDVPDPWGRFIRLMYGVAFCCALEVQTWTMNKLSSTLIFLLGLKLFLQSLTAWSIAAEWLQFIVGWILSIFAFYVFMVDLTNQIYHRNVFKTYKWSEDHSPEEAFGAAGRANTLYSRAAQLREANYIRVHRGALRSMSLVKKD